MENFGNLEVSEFLNENIADGYKFVRDIKNENVVDFKEELKKVRVKHRKLELVPQL